MAKKFIGQFASFFFKYLNINVSVVRKKEEEANLVHLKTYQTH